MHMFCTTTTFTSELDDIACHYTYTCVIFNCTYIYATCKNWQSPFKLILPVFNIICFIVIEKGRNPESKETVLKPIIPVNALSTLKIYCFSKQVESNPLHLKADPLLWQRSHASIPLWPPSPNSFHLRPLCLTIPSILWLARNGITFIFSI